MNEWNEGTKVVNRSSRSCRCVVEVDYSQYTLIRSENIAIHDDMPARGRKWR